MIIFLTTEKNTRTHSWTFHNTGVSDLNFSGLEESSNHWEDRDRQLGSTQAGLYSMGRKDHEVLPFSALSRSSMVFQGLICSQSNRGFFQKITVFISKCAYCHCYSTSSRKANQHNFQIIVPKLHFPQTLQYPYVQILNNLPLLKKKKHPFSPLSSINGTTIWHPILQSQNLEISLDSSLSPTQPQSISKTYQFYFHYLLNLSIPVLLLNVRYQRLPWGLWTSTCDLYNSLTTE